MRTSYVMLPSTMASLAMGVFHDRRATNRRVDRPPLARRDILGGAAATEAMWDGYRISSASHVVSLMPDRIVAELDLKSFGQEVSIITPTTSFRSRWTQTYRRSMSTRSWPTWLLAAG